ncbi:SDR family NAD(P)-dependent oxidoreductase [Streptomyces sp. NPDC002680]|uniref:SDR family NAD(P)-dependent oxidoreductase n=1 Tax=Streptomyces sp. NPDC002680 TaxID=3364659 RepID=UPI003676A9CD
MRLLGTAAVITGAGRGQGAATAALFAAEGASVVVGDIDLDAATRTAKTVADAGGTAIAVHADVSTANGAEALIEAASENFGRLDALVNNAGVALFKQIEDITEEEWDRVVDIDLKSVFLTCRAAIPLMRATGGGSVVNVASAAAMKPIRLQTAYAAAKAGVVQFTRALSLDVGGYGIRANCVCPGPIDTEMLHASLSELASPYDASRLPLGRIGKPAEVGAVSLFLCSPEASYMTGAVLTVDGGTSVGTR